MRSPHSGRRPAAAEHRQVMCVSLALGNALVVGIDALRQIERLVSEFFLTRGQGLLTRRQLGRERLRRFALNCVEQPGRVGEPLLRHLCIARVTSADRLCSAGSSPSRTRDHPTLPRPVSLALRGADRSCSRADCKFASASGAPPVVVVVSARRRGARGWRQALRRREISRIGRMEDSASCNEVANRTQPPQFRREGPTEPRANACGESARAAPHAERNRVSGSPRADARRRSSGRRRQRLRIRRPHAGPTSP